MPDASHWYAAGRDGEDGGTTGNAVSDGTTSSADVVATIERNSGGTSARSCEAAEPPHVMGAGAERCIHGSEQRWR